MAHLFRKEFPESPTPTNPRISVMRWSTASDVQLIASSNGVSTVIAISEELASQVGWALLQAAAAPVAPQAREDTE